MPTSGDAEKLDMYVYFIGKKASLIINPKG